MKNFKQFCKHFGLSMETGVAKTAYKEYMELHLGNTGKADVIDWSPSVKHSHQFTTTTAIKEEKNPMARDYGFSMPVATVQVETKPTNSERDYLLGRLRSLKSAKRDAAHKAADKPNQPQNFDELVKAITTTAYTVDQKRIDELKAEYGEGYGRYIPVFYAVKWTDYTGFDSKAYDAAVKAICAEAQKTEDVISVKNPIAGLDALNAFDAWTVPSA